MVGLGEATIGRANVLEIRIGFQFQYVQRPHFVAAAAAVARPAPAIVASLAKTVGALLLLGLARRRVLGGQAFEIIPVAIVFGGMALAEIPALGAVRRLGRRPVARLLATMAIELARRLGLARRAIAAP